MSRGAPFPWQVVPAYAVLLAAPWINRWINRPPKDDTQPPTIHQTSTQVRIIRRGTSRELERRRDG